MTDSSLPQSTALNPSDSLLPFPPRRWRPLRSRTYNALVGILSLCRTNFTHSQTQVDGACDELEPVTEKNGSISCNEIEATDILPPNSKDSNDTLIQETSAHANKENISFHDGCFDDKQATTLELDETKLTTEVEQEVDPGNKMSIGNFSVVENEKGDCAIRIANEQENVNSVLNVMMDDFGTLGELQVDKDFGIHDLSEVLDSCFGMDMVVESSKTGENNQENDSCLKENIPSEAEHELQLKAMELEKLISSSQLNDDEEIEEGEVSGEDRVADISSDALSEDAEPLGEKTKEKVHNFEDSCSKEKYICNSEDRRCWQREMFDTSPGHIVNTDCKSMQRESRTITRKMQECYSTFLNDSPMETQLSGPVPPRLESLTPSAKTLPDNAAEVQTSATAEQGGDVRKRKRKGPLTKERRAKKKKKERIKRAEKNRQLGVKRLKLQPVLKPKTVTYCRHYLQGRCHEGGNCKFSHDTIPLTKSKPCGHFARQSCMKGDDCPFDHQLSKYPCKNYISNGFCPRGSACLFSHEMPSEQSLPTTPNTSKPELTTPSAQKTMPDKGTSFKASNVTKPEMKFSSPLNNSNFSKHTNNIDLVNQKVDARFCATGNSSGNNSELLSKPVPRTVGHTPKGVSFLLNGSSMKTSDCVDVAHGTVLKVPGSINKNEISEKTTPRKPRGINFLSFAQTSSNDSSSKMISNIMHPNGDNRSGKSVIDVRNDGRLNCSMLESGCIEDPVRANSHFTKKDTGLSSGKEQASTPSGLQDTIKMPFLSFGVPGEQSTGGQNVNLSGSLKTSLLSNTPSSVQKAVQSTLAFAAKFETDIKVGPSSLHKQGR